ncbi:MAG: hypothetical protein J0G28_14475 [Afipia sp.]|nr:hypothetical protein [Afipia sp.]OJW65505.1 MAG: hypothetical protein BGO65_12320 [Afipia sp. 64-13]
MKQSRRMSLLETCLNTGAGFGISLLAQWFFLPLLGVAISFHQNVMFAIIMTFVSIARGFLLRRLFEALQIRVPMPASILAIAAERRRQVDVEGWTPEHDADHVDGELAQAGASYALLPAFRHGGIPNRTGVLEPYSIWPWSKRFYKPQDDRRDLIRAGALIAAELDRMDATRKRKRKAVRA